MTILIDNDYSNSPSSDYDASNSWNGFNHQGKLAMYESIRILNSIPLNDIRDYTLEIEYLEDFSILKNGKYILVNQVKTHANNYAITHKDAIWSLLDIVNTFPSVEMSYLHVANKIPDITDLKNHLKSDIDNFKKKNKDSLKIGVNKKSTDECIRDIINSGKFEEIFEKFSIYKYPKGNTFCELNEVDDLLKNQIKLFKKDVTEEEINRTFMHILGLVDRNIRENHHNIQSINKKNRKKISINFIEIYDVINKKYEHFSLEYASYFLKNEFGAIIRRYLDDQTIALKRGDIDEELFSKISKSVSNIYSQINKLSCKDFIEFCLVINPANQINKDISKFTPNLLTLLPEENLKQSFLEALNLMNSKLIEKKWIYTLKNNKGININYLPSTIINVNKPHEHISVMNKIINNPHNDFLMEVDIIITKEFKSFTLSKYDYEIMKNYDDPEEDDHKEKYHEKFTKIKNIVMIDLSQASEELSK